MDTVAQIAEDFESEERPCKPTTLRMSLVVWEPLTWCELVEQRTMHFFVPWGTGTNLRISYS